MYFRKKESGRQRSESAKGLPALVRPPLRLRADLQRHETSRTPTTRFQRPTWRKSSLWLTTTGGSERTSGIRMERR